MKREHHHCGSPPAPAAVPVLGRLGDFAHMGVRGISSCILIESPASESDEQFCDAVESMVHRAYGHRPKWSRFSAAQPGAGL